MRLVHLLVAVVAACAPLAARAAIVQADGSDLCVSNLAACQDQCASAGQYAFQCDQGGTFTRPTSTCKCVKVPPGVSNSMALLKLVQYSGAGACAGQTWLFDCAQSAIGKIQNGDFTIVPGTSLPSAAPAGGLAGGSGLGLGGGSGLGLSGGLGGGSGLGLSGGSGLGLSGGMGGGSGLGLSGGMGGGMGGGAGGGAGGGVSASSVLGMGRRLQQLAGASTGLMMPGTAGLAGPGAGAGYGLGSGATLGASAPAAPATFSPAGGAAAGGAAGGQCAKPVQGVVTSVNGAGLLVPGFKTLATAAARGNDTLVIQLPAGDCTATYRVMQGSLLTLQGALPTPDQMAAMQAMQAAAAATAKQSVLVSAAGGARAWAGAAVAGAAVAVSLLAL